MPQSQLYVLRKRAQKFKIIFFALELKPISESTNANVIVYVWFIHSWIRTFKNMQSNKELSLMYKIYNKKEISRIESKTRSAK